MTEEEILKEFKLSQEEHDDVYDTIKKIWTARKWPVDHPVAVIIGGQTGAGKSGIIGYSQKMFKDGNVVVINSDEIKPFHPREEEIAKNHPELYTKITDQESNTWTSRLFEETRNEHYNLIFEGTMWNNRVADEAIVDLLEKGYSVVVRGLAVSNLESRASILERYVGEKMHKGFGRLVVPEHHDRTYNGMPNTINYIQEQGRYSVLEIFMRGSVPSEPKLLYAAVNPDRAEETALALGDKTYVSHEDLTNGYEDARASIYAGRDMDKRNIIESFPDRVAEIVSQNNPPEVTSQVPALMEIYAEAVADLEDTPTE